MKRTPLFQAHEALGAKLIEFGGWEMPVYYTTIVDEHHAVRQAAGLFDISHMGEVVVQGAGAAAFLNHALTNDIRKLAVGQGQYTLMCTPSGGVVDDLYAYRTGEESYLLVINASRIDDDVAWLKKLQGEATGFGAFTLENRSDEYAAVALQGPVSPQIALAAFPGASRSGTPVAQVTDLKKNQMAQFEFQGQAVQVARTGYTGEDGFELIMSAGLAASVWNHVLAAGKAHGLKPAGLGARDTLRTEVCYPLYGHELNGQTTPIEAGVGFFVALDKGPFVGREPMAAQKAGGTARKLVAFRMTDRSAPPRPHYPIWSAGPDPVLLGEVTSGTQSPSLNAGIGLGYVTASAAKAETPIQIEIRGRKSAAVVVSKPIYRKAS